MSFNHPSPRSSCQSSDLRSLRSTVGGHSCAPLARRLASGRSAVFPPYSRHMSPFGLWRSPLPRNYSRAKAVCPKPETASACVIRRVSTTSPLPCTFCHTATSSDLSYRHVVTLPYYHVTSVHVDVTLLTSSCHVICRIGPTLLTSSSFLARKAKIMLRKPGSKF